jgi:multidrug efflux pump subunit AcrA (membrane-fusion protein)
VVGTSVEAGNVLAVLIDQAGREVRVTTPVAGTVIEVATQEGDFIRSGQGIATIQRFDDNLLALVPVPASSISRIVVGDEALVAPDSFPAGQYGYLKGVVISVAPTSMSVSRLEQLVLSVAGFLKIERLTNLSLRFRSSSRQMIRIPPAHSGRLGMVTGAHGKDESHGVIRHAISVTRVVIEHRPSTIKLAESHGLCAELISRQEL